MAAAGGGLALAATLLSGAVAEGDASKSIEVQSTGGGGAAADAATVNYRSGETLADAIAFADHASNGVSQITFSSGLSGDTISLSAPLPAIESALTIRGLGANELTIDGGGKTVDSPVFVVGHALSGTTTISGLTITDGYASSPGYHTIGGGAVRAYSEVELDADAISGNGSEGGGGGVWAGYGGDATLNESTVSGNESSWGAGIDVDHGSLAIRNSTIADNTAIADAGGIYLYETNGTPEIVGSTITENSAGAQVGGGIVVRLSNLALNDSIVAGNKVGSGGKAADIYDSIPEHGYTTAEFSLIGIADYTGNPVTTDTTDLLGTYADPKSADLGALQDNGGPTDTMLPLTGSPVIDAGKAYGLTSDQRGYQRPVDDLGHAFPAGGDGSDIGAVELQTATPQPAVVLGLSPSAGVAGASFEVDGTGLWDATGVTVAGVSASFSVIDPTTIEVTVPDGATTGDVEVTTPAGTSQAVAADRFTIIPATRTVTGRLDDQSLSLTYPGPPLAPSGELALGFRTAAIPGSKKPRLKLRSVSFWVGKGVKRVRHETKVVHGRRKRVTVTTYVANATRSQPSDSLSIALGGLKLAPGSQSIRAVATYTETVMVRHRRRTQQLSTTLRATVVIS